MFGTVELLCETCDSCWTAGVARACLQRVWDAVVACAVCLVLRHLRYLLRDYPTASFKQQHDNRERFEDFNSVVFAYVGSTGVCKSDLPPISHVCASLLWRHLGDIFRNCLVRAHLLRLHAAFSTNRLMENLRIFIITWHNTNSQRAVVRIHQYAAGGASAQPQTGQYEVSMTSAGRWLHTSVSVGLRGAVLSNVSQLAPKEIKTNRERPMCVQLTSLHSMCEGGKETV